MGRFHAAEQSRAAVEMKRRGPNGELRLGRTPEAGLLLSLDLDGTEISITVVYETADEGPRLRSSGRGA